MNAVKMHWEMEVSCQLHAQVTYLRVQSPLCTLNRKICGPRRQSRQFRVEKNLLFLLEMDGSYFNHSARSKVTRLTTLSKTPHANKFNYTEWKPFNPPHNSVQKRSPKFLVCMEFTLTENVG